eukprot:1847731-Pleurochrysis_carterae.AAC.4
MRAKQRSVCCPSKSPEGLAPSVGVSQGDIVVSFAARAVAAMANAWSRFSSPFTVAVSEHAAADH